METFKIKSWKENNQIKLEFGEINFSIAEFQSSFWAVEKELKENNYYANLQSEQNGNLLITAILPDIEPWITKVLIRSSGFDLEEIWQVVKTANQGLINHFK